MQDQASKTDQHLRDVLLNQLTWKPGVAQRVAVAIVAAVRDQPGDVFPDEVPLDFVEAKDAKVIGSTWKNLARQGIVKHGTRFRRSTKDASKGRTIFAYGLASMERADLFLKRNGGPEPVLKQAEMSVLTGTGLMANVLNK